MADEQATTQATDDQLTSEYNDIVEHHREYLNKLQSAFDKHCEDIGAAAKKKLAETPEDDKEARKQILMEEQGELDLALAELKEVVGKSGADVRHKLEEIENQREASAVNLEAELANL